ncbi:hypothetical protein L7F22_066022 [Adiantum nelumboides]|nr:hypothetical protein [Adiantum nelumboides]
MHQSGEAAASSLPISSPSTGEGSNVDDDGRPRRTGTLWTASAHIVTAVIGSGVLSLAWSMAKLGWVAGPLALLIFAVVTYFTSLLLADCYRSPPAHPSGPQKRNRTYMEAVRANLGPLQTKLCMLSQYTNLLGITVGYTITASISMVAIKRANCFHERGHAAACFASTYTYMKFFAIVEIFLPQIPNFSKLWWLSIAAATMSFSYSYWNRIGDKQGRCGHSHGTSGGSIYSQGEFFKQDADNIWLVLQALGNIAFAYSYTALLIEIQDTLKSPPEESQVMKKANLIGITTTTIFYMLCGCIGYAAFGDDSPGNLLTGFGFYEPYWLVGVANAFVTIHLVGAYQVLCQPIFAFIEEWISDSYPKSQVLHKNYKFTLPFSKIVYHANIFKLVWRTCYVIMVTLIAMILPFFNDILGLIGASALWPLTVYFPIQMYIARSKIQWWKTRWILLQALSLSCLLISIAALVGSIQSVIKDLKTYKPFHENH